MCIRDRYKVMPNLVVSGFIRTDMYTQNIEGKTAFGGTDTPGYSVGKYQNKEMNYELMAQYDKRWDEISLSATLGGNAYDRRYSYCLLYTSDAADDLLCVDLCVRRIIKKKYILVTFVLLM
eukprot:TRINITY_DN9400_c0_g1_i1.p1 TRINITY_DN9400_c0_g1~~TRINITY_DN9400_c0_g1_i1.p1  ORF type:complete len:121 (-),score=24.95 TRINITY_DN9400_c0_g1_i1:15-377(-)